MDTSSRWGCHWEHSLGGDASETRWDLDHLSGRFWLFGSWQEQGQSFAFLRMTVWSWGCSLEFMPPKGNKDSGLLPPPSSLHLRMADDTFHFPSLLCSPTEDMFMSRKLWSCRDILYIMFWLFCWHMSADAQTVPVSWCSGQSPPGQFPGCACPFSSLCLRLCQCFHSLGFLNVTKILAKFKPWCKSVFFLISPLINISQTPS